MRQKLKSRSVDSVLLSFPMVRRGNAKYVAPYAAKQSFRLAKALSVTAGGEQSETGDDRDFRRNVTRNSRHTVEQCLLESRQSRLGFIRLSVQTLR